jgi:hypothetical protein
MTKCRIRAAAAEGYASCALGLRNNDMPIPRSAKAITDQNIQEVRARIDALSPLHAAALIPGCRFWEFTNAEGFTGEIIVWPDGRAALVSAAASHWGKWNNRTGEVRLDNGDIYNSDGGVGEDA